MTTSTPPSTPRSGSAAVIALSALLLIAAILGAVLLATVAKTPSAVDLAREQNKLKTLQAWGRIWPPTSILLFYLVLLFLVALGVVCRLWLREKATSNYTDRRGIFPVKALHVWKWVQIGKHLWLPSQDVVYHDPNRAPTATTIYSAGLWGNPGEVVVRQVSPEHVPAEQVRITQGAQLTQIAAASASGSAPNAVQRRVSDAVRGQLPNIAIYNDMDRPLVAPQVPAPSVIRGSHFERLLNERGEIDAQGNLVEKPMTGPVI